MSIIDGQDLDALYAKLKQQESERAEAFKIIDKMYADFKQQEVEKAKLLQALDTIRKYCEVYVPHVSEDKGVT